MGAGTNQTIEELMDGRPRRVSFLNAQCANNHARNSGYAAPLGNADLMLPYGIGVETAARMSGIGLAENPNGTGFCSALLRAGAHAAGRVRLDDVVKRVFDAVASAALILAAAPLLLMVVLMIRLESRGPVLFRQVRVGKNGKLFTMYKFRSMHVTAEARRAEMEANSDRAGICFKSRQDPRVTRVGRMLRRFSIDELPQILNVLKGDMSLVGPRPALPHEVAAYPAHARERLAVKPGITGLWQVSGRADIGFDKMIDLDVAYVRSRSLILDLLLLAMTVHAVLSGRGAY